MNTEPKKKRASLRAKAKRASLFRAKTLVCVIENPNLDQNFFGMVRAAEALGVGKIYVIDNGKMKLPSSWHEMRFNRNFSQLSASGIQWMYVKKFSTTSECLQHLVKKKFINAATSPHQKGKLNVWLNEGEYTQSHLAVWFGNEVKGLSPEALNACDFCIQIPMYGIIESMNISSCASIVLHHIIEKRHAYFEKKLSVKQKMLKSQMLKDNTK